MALDAYTVFILIGALAAWILALVVYFTAPHRQANRFLAVLLFFEATAQTSVGLGQLLSAASTPAGYGLQGVFLVSVVLLPVLYLLFLSTLTSPLVAWLKPTRVRIGLGAVGLTAAFLVLLVSQPRPPGSPRSIVELTVFAVFGAVAVFGLIVAASAYRRVEPGTLERRQAGAYLAAFGSRDGLFVLFFLLAFLGAATGFPLGEQAGWLPPAATMLFVAFMAYGILRTQLFDIDLKIRWTVKQSTVAAAFLAVFFVVSEGAAAFLGERLDSTYLGIGAAALLVFAMAPLQRLAGAVAQRAVPGARPVAEMDADERRRLYAGMVRTAFQDGTLDPQERVLLAELRGRLELSTDEAEALEVDVAREQGSTR